MRPIWKPATRTLLALVVVGAALAVWASVASAEGTITIRLPPGQGGSVSVPLDELTGYVNGRYIVRRSATSARGQRVVDGISLSDVLDKAGVDPAGFGHLQIERPTGGTVVLSRSAIYDAGPLPPVFYMGEDGLSFIRNSAGKEDFNSADSFALVGDALTAQLRKEGVMSARIKVEPGALKAGEEATFSAVVRNAPKGRKVTYRWTFGGGRTASGEEVEHTFAKARTYSVSLSVTEPTDGFNVVARTTIKVGEEAKEEPDEATGGTSPGLPPIVNTDPGTGTSSPDAYAPPPSPAPPPGSSGLDLDMPATGRPSDDGLIEGTLLADAATSPGPATAAAIEAADFEAPEPVEGAFGLPAAVWVLLGTFTLLGFGAGVEALRSRPRPLRPIPRGSS